MSARQTMTLRAELARKALHAATALVPIALSFGWVSLPAFRAVVSAAAVVALTIEALRFSWPAFAQAFGAAVGGLLRRHEHNELTGATWLALSMALVLWLAPPYSAVAALWAAAVGDAAAAVVGRGVARVAAQRTNEKTLVGSLAALIATAAGVLWLTPASWIVAFALGLVAAVAERPRGPLDDNLRVALAVALAATGLGLR